MEEVSQGQGVLLAPDWAGLDTIWGRPDPFVLWPVGGRSLLEHWLDAVVGWGWKTVDIYAPDRPEMIRRHLEGGSYWSLRITVHPSVFAGGSDKDVRKICGWPNGSEQSPQSPAELLQCWLALHQAWLEGIDPKVPRLEQQRGPGVWISPQAKVDATAVLHGPVWIGTGAEIGSGVELGPQAFVGAGAVLDEGVTARRCWIGPATYAGRHTQLEDVIVQGGLLINLRLGCKTAVRERFLLSSLEPSVQVPSLGERLLAGMLWLRHALSPSRQGMERIYELPSGDLLTLVTGVAGSLAACRRGWLREVIGGKLRLFGVLPRTREDWQGLPPDVSAVLRQAPAGVFSYADVMGCHAANHSEEYLHALYQAQSALEPELGEHLRRSLRRLLWSQGSAKESGGWS